MDISTNSAMDMRALTAAVKKYAASGKKTPPDDKFAEKLKAAANTDSVVISKDHGSISEQDKYKLQIYSKIDKMTTRSRHGKNISAVYITDAGFEAMRNDPQYEQWVMGQIKSAVTQGGYGRGERTVYTAVVIEGSKEECRFESFTDITPTKEEYEQIQQIRRRRLKALEKASIEKYNRYRKALAENSLKKSKMEIEHIKGNFDDALFKPQNLNTASFVSKLFLYWK